MARREAWQRGQWLRAKKFHFARAQQKSLLIPLLPENGRYRLSMKSDQSRHQPIGEA
jgi:hypothetical protein